MTFVEIYKTKFVTTAFLFIATLVWVLGCEEPKASSPQPPSISQVAVASAEGKDLAVSLRLPRSNFVIGEDVPVTIIAVNRGKEGLRFSASTSAPYRIRLERSTPLGWVIVKTYPEAAAMVLAEWSLRPGEKRTLRTKLRADRDWPTYEDLRLRVNLPGRGDVAPFVHIEVTPKQ